MSVSRQVGAAIAVSDGVPPGLQARAVETLVDDGEQQRVRRNRRGLQHVQDVALVADPDAPADATDPVELAASTLGHPTLRTLLSASSRKRSPSGQADDDTALLLARAGLVELRCKLEMTADGLSVRRWSRWVRTPAGEQVLDSYRINERAEPQLVTVARTAADTGGTLASWQVRFAAAYAEAASTVERAVQLLESGEAAGWPLSRFAREVTGATHGLDPDAGLVGRLVFATVTTRLSDPDADRMQVWADAGLAIDALGSVAVSVGLPPGGDGPAGTVLAGGYADRMPVTVPRVRLTADLSTVGPAPPGGIVFAVENEALLSWAWRQPVCAPVVWSTGSDAVARLLTACAMAGWQVAISADMEPGGLARVASLLRRVPGAVPWRLTTTDYTDAIAAGAVSGQPFQTSVTTLWDLQLGEQLRRHGLRVTEEDRFELLADDLVRHAACPVPDRGLVEETPK